MKKGIQLALLTALISGISIFSNGIFVSKTDPLVFAFVRNTIVALLFSVFLFITASSQNLRELSAKKWGMLALIGLLAGDCHLLCFLPGYLRSGLSMEILSKKHYFSGLLCWQFHF